ncbi:MAG: outer membrane beta-barrel protein [Saprospiraceae bacterium]|nr:outer membrane beta-barrel protein [Candidatus Vicinibacter affinis]
MSDRKSEQESLNNFYKLGLFIDSVAVLNQILQTNNDKSQIKSSVQYVEPLGKRFFIQSFYNYSNRNTDYQRDVFDQIQDSSLKNQFLSRNFENNIEYHRIGTSLRYSYKGANLSIGLAFQDLLLQGRFKTGFDSSNNVETKVVYQNFIPNFSLQMDLKKIGMSTLNIQ